MKKMNKILAILLALTMMLALAACNGGNSGDSSNSGFRRHGNGRASFRLEPCDRHRNER